MNIDYDKRTHHLETDPTDPQGRFLVVENGKHLGVCGQCHDLIEKADDDKRTGKYPNMCDSCVLSEVM